MEVMTYTKKATLERLERQSANETLEKLVNRIKNWHYDRNLIDGATDKDQLAKLIQEMGELSDNICKGKDVADDIGDIMVVLINIAERNGLSLRHCLEVAYSDIKDRKGKMVDGVFIKEKDDFFNAKKYDFSNWSDS